MRSDCVAFHGYYGKLMCEVSDVQWGGQALSEFFEVGIRKHASTVVVQVLAGM